MKNFNQINMKKILFAIVAILFAQFFLIACKETLSTLGDPPKQEDASFTFAPTTTSPNILSFTNTSSAFLKKWDFGNGTKAEGNDVTGTFPSKGSYTVKLTVFSSGGSVSSSQVIVIAADDPTLLNIPVYNFLTGGVSKPAGKTWIIDSKRAGHFGVGPNPSDAALGDVPNYYAAGANEKPGTGLYDDEFTFVLAGFKYTQNTNGDVYLNGKFGTDFPGSFDNLGDKTAPFTAPTNLTWTLSGPTESPYQNLTISTGGFIGYYCGTTTYKIVSISENELIIRAVDAKDAGLAWYQRLIPKDFVPPPSPPPAFSTLPLDFEGVKPPFTGFGGSTYDVVANPSATGLNTSAKVAKYVKGTEGNWAGIETILASKIDLSTNSSFQYKVYSPVLGRALFKIETVDKSVAPVEVFADVTQINTWQTLNFSFAGAATNTFDKIALFLDFDNNNGGTFYLDDIKQVSVPATLTLSALNGGSSKAWILKPAAGSFGVGPGKGSDAYYPNGQDLSAARPCLFNDEFIFKTGSVYQYDTKGDVFGEAYLGITPDGCQPESALGVNAKAWGSGTHTFTFDPATGSTPAYITVTGTGAFIVLPKAKNGGEYSTGPPTTNASVKYEVLNYVKNGTVETLSLTLDIGGGTFWNFVLINK
jgi:PKD domain